MKKKEIKTKYSDKYINVKYTTYLPYIFNSYQQK